MLMSYGQMDIEMISGESLMRVNHLPMPNKYHAFSFATVARHSRFDALYEGETILFAHKRVQAGHVSGARDDKT